MTVRIAGIVCTVRSVDGLPPGFEGWAVLEASSISRVRSCVRPPWPSAVKVPGALSAGAADPRGTVAGGENSRQPALAGVACPYRRPAFPHHGPRAWAAARRRGRALRHDRRALRRPAVLGTRAGRPDAIRPSLLTCAKRSPPMARAACLPIPPPCASAGYPLRNVPPTPICVPLFWRPSATVWTCVFRSPGTCPGSTEFVCRARRCLCGHLRGGRPGLHLDCAAG